jgi:PIN domain nuclease of toxin-antitoxin system
MNYLVDTHILIWSFIEPERLEQEVKNILLNEENTIYYSQISLWEISIKYALRKIILNGMKPEELYEEIEVSYYKCKTISNNNLVTFYQLPIEHKDPFDRMLIWQSIESEYIFISNDKEMGKYLKYGLKTI